MPRIGLLSLQLLVAFVAVGSWYLLTKYPICGLSWLGRADDCAMVLPPFFFSTPIKVWERIHSSGASMAKKDESLPAYLDSRRKLAEEWKRVKPLLAAAPTAESTTEVQKFFESLPPTDGRRKPIEAWRDEKK